MRTVYSFRNLLQHRAICKSDGIAVEIDRVVVGKAVDRAVTGQIPDASGIDRNNGIVVVRFFRRSTIRIGWNVLVSRLTGRSISLYLGSVRYC